MVVVGEGAAQVVGQLHAHLFGLVVVGGYAEAHFLCLFSAIVPQNSVQLGNRYRIGTHFLL